MYIIYARAFKFFEYLFIYIYLFDYNLKIYQQLCTSESVRHNEIFDWSMHRNLKTVIASPNVHRKSVVQPEIIYQPLIELCIWLLELVLRHWSYQRYWLMGWMYVTKSNCMIRNRFSGFDAGTFICVVKLQDIRATHSFDIRLYYYQLSF